ncbi:hypothetical protein [Halanaerobium congolense]|uniref:hypothetical protein n=1 Tax=Halanaerobium congolense TaxID=54121 RepID=UPI000D3AF27B|nr:hypothetical protein [Halanaerobium congolense]
MAKAALMAKQESFNSFMRFFAKNKNKIEKLAGEKIELEFIYNYSSEKDINFEKLDLNTMNSIKVVNKFKDLLSNSKIDIIIDLSQNEDVKDYIIQSLKNKKNVITSNKKCWLKTLVNLKDLKKSIRLKYIILPLFLHCL